MDAADDNVSVPWRWILEHLVDIKDIGTPILRGMLTYLPNSALHSSLQKRTALRYLEEAIAGDKIDAHVIPLVAILLEESQAMSSYPTSSDYSDLLLRVQVEAVITHIRGKVRDWRGFSQALDHIFSEDAMDAQFLKKREELSTLLQVQDQEKKRVEVLEFYSLTSLRRDLLKSITSEKARLERTFLDKLLQDVFNGKYPISAGLLGQPASEKEESHEEFHSVDVQRHSVGSDDQTVLGGRISNDESEDDVETNLKVSAATHMPREDSIGGVHQARKRVGLQNGNGPTKRMSYGRLDLRQRDECGKAVTSASPMKGTQKSNPIPVTNKEDALEVEGGDGSTKRMSHGRLNLRQRDECGRVVTSSSPFQKSNLRPPAKKEILLEVEENSLHVEYLEVGSDGHEELCHKCKEGGSLLCCDGCPIAVHRRCLGFDSEVSMEEEWFCPLCTQKRAVEAVKKAREEELAARQRVLQFVANTNEERSHEKQTSTYGSKRKSEQNGGKKSVQDDPENAVDSEQNGAKTCFHKTNSKPDASKKISSPLNGKEKQNSNKASSDPYEEGVNYVANMVSLSHHSSTIGPDRKGKDHDKWNRFEKPRMQDTSCDGVAEEVLRPSICGNDFTSSRTTNVASSSRAGQINQVDVDIPQANVDVPAGDGDGHDGDLEEDSEEQKFQCPKPKKDQKFQSPKPKKDPRLYSRHNRIVPGMRRKRLLWRKEEEDALREGVSRFSCDNGHWGFQWTRILEFGQGTFHPSRTVIDLKDKWRNLAKHH